MDNYQQHNLDVLNQSDLKSVNKQVYNWLSLKIKINKEKLFIANININPQNCKGIIFWKKTNHKHIVDLKYPPKSIYQIDMYPEHGQPMKMLFDFHFSRERNNIIDSISMYDGEFAIFCQNLSPKIELIEAFNETKSFHGIIITCTESDLEEYFIKPMSNHPQFNYSIELLKFTNKYKIIINRN